LHPNSHPSSICVLSSHLLRCPKIGQAAFENVSQISVGHADLFFVENTKTYIEDTYLQIYEEFTPNYYRGRILPQNGPNLG
jgi:hypothetical protein